MRSTGEVLGLADNAGEAFLKAEEATLSPLPRKGNVYFCFDAADRKEACEVAKALRDAGFGLCSSGESANILHTLGCTELTEDCALVSSQFAAHGIQLIIDTTGDMQSPFDSQVRREAIRSRTPYITTLAAALAASDGLRYCRHHESNTVNSLQSLHRRIRTVQT